MANDIPAVGRDRRKWILYQLSLVENPATGRRWTANDIAQEAFAEKGTVSLTFSGERVMGPITAKIQRITARVLGLSTDDLFGVALEAGDGYAGSSPAALAARDAAAERVAADKANHAEQAR